MKIPPWAPVDLVSRREQLQERVANSRRRLQEGKLRRLDPVADARAGRLYVGSLFPGDETQLEILESMIFEPVMERFWSAISRRAYVNKPRMLGMLFGGKTQSLSIFGACIGAKFQWINNHGMTRAQYRDHHRAIARLAGELADLLLLNTQDIEMLDVREFLPSDYITKLSETLKLDEFVGSMDFLEHVIGEGMPSIATLLLALQGKALKRAEAGVGVSQPNSPDAEMNHFIRKISSYFQYVYERPMHECVALLAEAVFNRTDVDENRVKALIRTDRQTGEGSAGMTDAEFREEH